MFGVNLNRLGLIANHVRTQISCDTYHDKRTHEF
jgi:hypothetical protein